jgi:thiol:disulfide interchange protein DsbC
MKSKKVAVPLLLISVILTVSLFAFAGNSPDPCKNVTNDSITKHLNLPDFRIASKRNVADGLCEAVLMIKDDLLPVYVSDEFVIVGDMFKSKVHITKEKVTELNAAIFKENKAALDKVTAFTYTPAQVKSTLYYITDPDCPYYERAKLQMKQFADDNSVELKVIFFPLPMHPNAKDKAIKAICGKMKYQDYLDGKYEGNKCKEGEDKIEKSINVIEKLKVNGTPTFISADGERAMGFIPEKIKEIL